MTDLIDGLEGTDEEVRTQIDEKGRLAPDVTGDRSGGLWNLIKDNDPKGCVKRRWWTTDYR